MAKTSKWKEEREVVTCIILSPSNTALTHTLSFTLMAKLKLEEEEQQQLQLLTKQQNTTLFSEFFFFRPHGGY